MAGPAQNAPKRPLSDTPLPPESELHGPIWKALTSEPGAGVGLITSEGTVLYLNEQAAQIFHGPSARAADWLGTSWHSTMPEHWTKERLAVLARMQETNRPVLMRTIWRGRQQLTWVYRIGPTGGDDDGVERFLTITRRVADDDEAATLTSQERFDLVESDIMRLGPLDTLSERELEVLALIGQGLSMKEIASLLYRSVKTVDSHRSSIGRKLQLDDRVRLASIAKRAGLTLSDAARKRV